MLSSSVSPTHNIEEPREALDYEAVVIPDARHAYSYFGSNNLSTLTNAFLKGQDEPRVLYIVVRRPEDMSVAINVADAAGFNRCFWWPVFLCHTVSKGPKRTDLNTPPSENVKGLASHTASCHWQVLCFVANPNQVEVFKPISHQLITLPITRKNLSPSSNIDFLTPLLDNIADHLSLSHASKRAVIVSEIDGKSPFLSEYDIIDHDADKNAFVVKSPARKFNLSSARKSRMLKAYLESPKLDVTTLKHDLDALQSHFASKDDYDPNRKIISIVPPRDHEDFVTSKPVILAQVQSQIRLLRKRNRMQNASVSAKSPAKKKKRTPSSNPAARNKGIGAKTPVTDALRDFLVDRCGLDPFEANDGIPRTEVVRAIPKYIKKEGLATGRNVQPDEALRKLLPSPDFDEQLTYFSVFKHINHNFLKDKKNQNKSSLSQGLDDENSRISTPSSPKQNLSSGE